MKNKIYLYKFIDEDGRIKRRFINLDKLLETIAYSLVVLAIGSMIVALTVGMLI